MNEQTVAKKKSKSHPRGPLGRRATFLANLSWRRKVTVDVPDARANRAGPRSVQKANSYQFLRVKRRFPFSYFATAQWHSSHFSAKNGRTHFSKTLDLLERTLSHQPGRIHQQECGFAEKSPACRNGLPCWLQMRCWLSFARVPQARIGRIRAGHGLTAFSRTLQFLCHGRRMD